jgi:hypothetical protein
MGARNVSAVFAMYPDLAPLPKLLLVWMALKSLDAQGKDGRPPRVFYDGEDSLIEACGRSRSQVYAALKVLRSDEVKAVEVLVAGRMRSRAVYKLRLDPMERGGRQVPSVRESGPRSVRKTGRNWVRESGFEGPENRTPIKNEGGTEESRGGDKSRPAVVSPAPGAPVDNPEFDEMTAEQANRELIHRFDLEPALRMLDQHGATHPDCNDPARHLLATTPNLRVLKGGAA